MRIFNSLNAFQAPICDTYRYIDWFLNMLLLLIEVNLVMKVSLDSQAAVSHWQLRPEFPLLGS